MIDLATPEQLREAARVIRENAKYGRYGEIFTANQRAMELEQRARELEQQEENL